MRTLSKGTLPETATLWRQGGQDGYGGEALQAPVQIPVRWEDLNIEALSVAYREEAETVISGAVVYSNVEFKAGDYIYRGITSETNPQRLTDAYAIRHTTRTTGVRGRLVEYTAHLK